MNRIHNERILLRGFILFSLLTLGAAAVIVGSDKPASPAEDGTMDALKSIAGQAMMDPYAYSALEELSDQIGGRVSGTPEAAHAENWAVERMKALGLENVHKETVMLTRGWARGSAEAEIISPVRRRLRVSSLGWVGSTATGGVEGELVSVNRFQFDEEIKENAAKWAGKILFITEKGDPPDEKHPQHGIFGKFLEKAHAAHALAVIGTGGGPSAGMQLTHPYSPGWNQYFELPAVSITAEDQWLLERFLAKKDPVRVRIGVQNHVTPGPAESANVVGEIRGREHPEQIIVVGGHLDSWDLADGTTDDGMGVATTLGSARAITQARLQPRRTLRFVLFTGEEQGLVGSLAYVQTHKDEMVNHVAAIILDIGQGPVTGLNLGGRKDLIPAVQRFADAIKGFAALKVTDDVLFGTDSGPFTLAGLPGIYMSQDSPDYAYTHHTEADTFDKVKQDILARDTAVVALTAYWIADRPERLAIPWPAEKTAKMLVEKKLDLLLKAHDRWPFGEVGSEAKKSNP
jgi:Zn-dependent M28 family amino/carboxypeptidase